MTKTLKRPINIGFISFRFQGTDGVSLETTKWAEILEEMGHRCYYFSGLSDRPSDRSMVVEEAHFLEPETREYYYKFFGSTNRTQAETKWIHSRREFFKKHLYSFIENFKLDLLIPQNLLSFPLNIPLSLALVELIAETGIPTIAHHHDFTWERKPLLVNSIWDYITMAVPPSLRSVQHVVINSSASHQLARRVGVSSINVPNVMDFENPPPETDEYSSDLREALGIEPDELFILQPTRVVQRKGIEHAIELVSRLGRKARLVISHASGDDGFEYEARVADFAERMGVRTIFSSERFGEYRGTTEDGKKIYSLSDAYPHADLVTYPSLIEGFGNAFLEALYYRKPIVVNNYAIYATDIRPKGFKVIEFDDYITKKTVQDTLRILDDSEYQAELCSFNYALALRHFSYKVLRSQFRVLLANAFGLNEA
ncbi:MAG: glycosyltransferase family 4 protein [Anaerolineae bacterium]|nr:glycosyltransferase family 4 protein [Anaerolineae bacterium]MDK1081502.1 glycosyltransferase family 4 protein [Anaerolineae bacterium]MDK1118816.1 glycosyltransferase family 4 protein [Anaerolineae bacterium]